MKKVLALTALSAALFASFPAVGADAPAAEPVAAVPAKPAVKPFSSPMIDALTALAAELKAVVGTGKGNPIPHLDKLATHQYSPATAEKLRKVFGTAEPLQIKRSDAVPGMVGYTISAPAHSYTDPENGSTVAWEDLTLDMTLDKQGRDLTSNGSWPSVSISSKDVTVTASGMTMQSKQHRTAQDLWLGKMQAGIETIAAGPGGKGVLFEGFAVSAATTQRGTGVDFAYDTRIKAIKADTVQIDDVRMNMRMSNIDMRLLEKLGNEYNLAERAAMKPEQQAALMFKLFKAMGKSAAARGSALDIDEISAGYRGNRFVIKGKLSLAKSTDAELASMAGVAKKVNVRLNVQVPLALVTDVAMVVMAKQAEAKKEPMSEAALAQAAQSVTDVIVGKLLTGNLAKLENGVLVSLIEYKAGKLTFNGKEVALPKPAPAAPQAAGKN